MADTEQLQDKETQDVGLRFAGTPGDYKTAAQDIGTFASKLQAQSPVPEYQKTGEDKLKALFAFDQQLEQNYDPLAQQRTQMYGTGVIGNPADVYNPASQTAGQMAGGVGDIFQAISQYKSLEGTALSNALSTVFNFLQTAENRKKRKEDNLWKVLQATGGDWTDPDTGEVHHIPSPEEKAALEAKYRAGTTADRTTNLLNQVATGARNYTNLESLMKEYGTQVDPSEILRIYNLNSPFGTAKEKPEELYKKFGVVPPARAPEADMADDESNLLSSLEGLSNLSDNAIRGYFNPASTEGQKLQSTIDIMTQTLARLFEKGRMSDADRIFYLKQTRHNALDIVSPERYKARVQGVIDSLKQKYGVDGEGQGGGENNDPLGIR